MHPADSKRVSVEQSHLQSVVARLKQGEKYATIQADDADFSLLRQAVADNAIEAMLWLVAAGASVNPPSGSLLLVAVKHKYWSAAQILLCLGANKALATNDADDAVNDDIKALSIEKNMFQALLYWAVINYPLIQTTDLLSLLVSRIVDDQPAVAVLAEKKSSDLHEPLLTPQLTVNTFLAHQLQRDFSCLAQLARQQDQPELAAYLQTFNNQPEPLNSAQMLANSESLHENYLRVLAPLFKKPAFGERNLPRDATDQKNSPPPRRDSQEPTLPLSIDHESSTTNVTAINDFLNALHDELTGRLFRFKRLTGFDKSNLLIFIAMWAVIIPGLLVSESLVSQGDVIRSRMANTPYAMNPLWHCDFFLDSQQRYRCDSDIDFGNCEDFCSALTTINSTLSWLLGLGIIAPAIVALFTLPTTLVSLYQLASEDLNAFDDLPLTAFSARLQDQAEQLLVKLQLLAPLDVNALSVDSSVKTMRLALERIKNNNLSVNDSPSSPPPSGGNSSGLAISSPGYAYQRRHIGAAIKDTMVSDVKQP